MADKKTVVLGVTGSIAAHKAVDLCGLLTKAGVDVHVVMTEAAQEFISPLPFKTLSKNPVIASLYDEEEGWCPTHIQLANRADLLLIAPATANTIAKLTLGLSGDALGCIALALKPGAGLIIAPALNDKMWQHPATQANVVTLTKRGARIVGPFEGELACGCEGLGRLAPIEDIAATALQAVGLAL